MSFIKHECGLLNRLHASFILLLRIAGGLWYITQKFPEPVLSRRGKTCRNASTKFNSTTLKGEKDTTRFFHKDNEFWVNTIDGDAKDFKVAYAGVAPLQQYLLETDGGRLQALGVAWDVEQPRCRLSGVPWPGVEPSAMEHSTDRCWVRDQPEQDRQRDSGRYLRSLPCASRATG